MKLEIVIYSRMIHFIGKERVNEEEGRCCCEGLMRLKGVWGQKEVKLKMNNIETDFVISAWIICCYYWLLDLPFQFRLDYSLSFLLENNLDKMNFCALNRLDITTWKPEKERRALKISFLVWNL